MILVDTNIIVDAILDPASKAGEALRLALQSDAGINPIILAELAGGLKNPAAVIDVVPNELKRLSLPWAAAPIAARAFRQYRQATDGPKTSPLPDFYIGAHAEADGLTVLTSNKGRYKTYFPRIDVLFP
jgi:predicted nucleic acid-binding protein